MPSLTQIFKQEPVTLGKSKLCGLYAAHSEPMDDRNPDMQIETRVHLECKQVAGIRNLTTIEDTFATYKTNGSTNIPCLCVFVWNTRSCLIPSGPRWTAFESFLESLKVSFQSLRTSNEEWWNKYEKYVMARPVQKVGHAKIAYG